MKICIAAQVLQENDAIGNDVAHQLALLNSKDISTVVYAQEVTNSCTHVIDEDALFDMIDDPDNLLIYHHGGCWEAGLQILEKARCKIFIKHHNVTPPDFFKPYSLFHETYCHQGQEQTLAIARLDRVTKFLCDSRFNAKDFLQQNVDASKITIVPPFHKLDEFHDASIQPDLACQLDDGRVNLLFVGRLVPNKGHAHLIRVIDSYRAMYDENIRLTLVGGIDSGLKGYEDELNQFIQFNQLEGLVKIKGSVSFDELHTYYRATQFFLLMSSHEGFCLPVLEAQFHSLPVIALGTSAVAETMGENQVVFDTPDYQRFAAAIHVLSENQVYADYIANQGKKNVRRFSNKIIEEKFLKAVLN